MNETRRLAEFMVETRYQDLPAHVVEAVRVYILDDFAAGCAGARTPWSDMVAGLVRESSVGECTIFGRDWTTSPAAAALINGVAVGGFEVDHPFTPGSCHPSGAVFPAALAVAERRHCSGRDFLTAVATGYELLCRVGLAATRAVEDVRGFHGPGTNSAFGAAAASGKLLGFDAHTLNQALGIAGSHGGGLVEFHHEGAMTKRLHLGRGSQMGMECALLAQRGFTGPSTVLEGSHGFLHAYSPAPKVERLTERLGEHWESAAMVLKAYPCHISFHAVIDGLRAFRQQHAFSAADIERIRIVGSKRMMEDRHSDPAPTTLMGAQYSLPWSAGIALTADVADPRIWVNLDFADAAVARLAAMVERQEDSERFGQPGGPAAEVTLTVAGTDHTLVVTNWKGAPSNPYSYADITGKFLRYADGVLTPDRANEVVRRVARLEDEGDMAELARLIAG